MGAVNALFLMLGIRHMLSEEVIDVFTYDGHISICVSQLQLKVIKYIACFSNRNSNHVFLSY